MSEYCQLPGEKSQIKNACLRNLVISLKEALDFLKWEFGNDKSNWKWENLHYIEYSHMPLSKTALKMLFHWETKAPGSSNTVNVGRYNPSEFKSTNWLVASNVPVLRIATDMGTNEGYYSLDTGESGHLLSGFYFNMNERHINVDPYPMYFNEDPRIESNANHHLYLISGPEWEWKRAAIKTKKENSDL